MNTKSAAGATAVAMAIGIMQMLQPFSIDPYLSSLQAVSADLAVGSAAAQLSLSAVSLGFAFGMVIAGPLSDAVGRRRPLFAALGLYILAGLTVAFSSDYAVFMTGRGLQGFSGAAMTVVTVAILRDLFQGMEMIRANARVMVFGAAAWFIGPAGGSLALGVTNWRGISVTLAVIAVAVAVYAWRAIPETMPVAERRSINVADIWSRFVHVFQDRSYIGFVIIQICIGVAMFGYLGITPTLYQLNYGIVGGVGLFIAINSFGAYLGVQAGAKTSQKFGPQWVLATALIVGILDGAYLLAIGPTHPSLFAVDAGLFVWAVAFGITITPAQAMAMQPHGEEAGTAASLLGAVSFLVTSLAGPYLTSLSHSTTVGIGMNQMIMMSLAVVAYAVFVRPWGIKALR